MPLPLIIVLSVVALLAVGIMIFFINHYVVNKQLEEKTPKTLEYSDLLNEDFAEKNIKEKQIDENFKYVNKNVFYKFCEIVYYRLIFIPIALTYCKALKKIKYVNKKKFKEAKKTGFFLYGNHTNAISDAFSPSLMTFPKKPYIIVDSKNLNIPILKGSTKMLGALPIPTSLDATKNFMNALKLRVNKSCIVIYPEAHLWPYYTSIRPFKSVSFKYPIKFNVPTFCSTTTYQKTKRANKFKTVIYIDGPFYASPELNAKEQAEDLRNQVYNAMLERSKNSTFEKIIYKQKGETND